MIQDMKNEEINFVYFGGEPLSVPVLEELKVFDLLPSLIICSPDKPVGRKQVMTAPPVKLWAEENGIETWQPDGYKGDEAQAITQVKLSPLKADVFVVVAYNYILPQWLLDMSPNGVINVHPSMLPKLRGASPIRTAIMNNERDHIGASVMLLDNKMDHGPILAQMHMPISDELWPVPGPDLDEALARMGGAMLADVLPKYLAGDVTPVEQNHADATYCGRLSKDDSELQISPLTLPTGAAAEQALRIHHAFMGMGGVWFMYEGKRVKIKEAECSAGTFRPLTVVPEGKSAMLFTQWLDNQA